jgi:hypothetical protein
MMSKGDRSLTSAKSLVVAYRSNQTSVLTKWSKIMKKLVIGTALILTALPFTFDGVTPAVSKAHAIIGRPLTPLSVAGMHRRAVRRTFGVGANLGYSGFYHRNFGPYAYNRLGYGYHLVARAAVYGAAAYGAGWGSSGWNRPLYAYAGPAYRPAARAAVLGATAYGAGWGGGWGGWGWNRPLYGYAGLGGGWGGWGWNRPLYSYAGMSPGWGGGWRGWGWNRGWGW